MFSESLSYFENEKIKINMEILIFIAVLVVLILVHEWGHYIAAKWAGMDVEEFGIGYPPRALTLGTRKGTAFTLNWLPFGGFVKIRGEDGEDAGEGSFSKFSWWKQSIVLVAGVTMNFLLAWVLISIMLGIGTQRALSPEEVLRAPDATLAVSNVVPNSPGARAGLLPGDIVKEVNASHGTFEGSNPEAFITFVSEVSVGESVLITFLRGGEEKQVALTPEAGVIAAHPERLALGVGIASVGTVSVPWYEAPFQGFLFTINITVQTFNALIAFFASAFTLSADLSQVAGPVGIAGAVGDASNEGIIPLLFITALISINLAIINLLPFPALDGGRLVMVLFEACTKRKIPDAVTNALNTLGFAFLILLMLAVTASDISKLL